MLDLEDQSFSSWTEAESTFASSTASATSEEGGHHQATAATTSTWAANDDTRPALNASAVPLHDTIGMLAENQSNTTKICVNVKARDLPSDHQDSRPHLDIVVCIDRSTSMEGQKLRDSKATLELMMRNLNSMDRLGLVTFGTDAQVIFPIANMTPENKERVVDKIRGIRAHGNTNLSGGLSLASQEMHTIDKPNPVRSIFLLTDGWPNIGITNVEGLATMAASMNDTTANQNSTLETNVEGMEVTIPGRGWFGGRKKQRNTTEHCSDDRDINQGPVSLFCFGYSAEHNSKVLRAMADASPGGAYYFVEKDEDVSPAFGDALGGLFSVVAQSITVTLSVPPPASAEGVKIRSVYHKEAIDRGNGVFTVNIGDAYAEESRDLLLEVELGTKASVFPTPHLTVTLSYTNTMQKRNVKEGVIVCLIARPPSDELSPLNSHVEEQWLRVYTAQEIAAADVAAQANKLHEARARLHSSKQYLMSSPVYSNGSAEATSLVGDVDDTLHAISSTAVYRSGGSHFTANCQMKMSHQRCMASSGGDVSSSRSARYATGYKNALREEYKAQLGKLMGGKPKDQSEKK